MSGKMNANFPIPVLLPGGDDYLEGCSFGVAIDEEGITVDESNICIPVSYVLKSSSLCKLVEEGKAVVAVSSKSPSASFSQLDVFGNGACREVLEIGKYSVLNRIDVQGVVIASVRFQLDGSYDLNPDYFDNAFFEIRKGDILALDKAWCIYIDDSELEQPLTSVFTIRHGGQQEAKLISDFSDEKIAISLSGDFFGLYNKFVEFNNGALARYVNGLVVFPVLVEAISIMMGESGQEVDVYRDKRWFRAIEKKAAARGVDISGYRDSAATLADQLLGDISYDALRQFEETFEVEFNNGDMEILGGAD